MEREIKFRAKRLDNNEWVYGDLHLRCLKPHIHTSSIENSILSLKFNVNEYTIGQFTERYDTKLNEIFENDIVRVNIGDAAIICIVKWNKDVGAWCLLINGDTQIGVKPLGSFLCDIRYRIEVIGNIYDNANLLEE